MRDFTCKWCGDVKTHEDIAAYTDDNQPICYRCVPEPSLSLGTYREWTCGCGRTLILGDSHEITDGDNIYIRCDGCGKKTYDCGPSFTIAPQTPGRIHSGGQIDRIQKLGFTRHQAQYLTQCISPRYALKACIFIQDEQPKHLFLLILGARKLNRISMKPSEETDTFVREVFSDYGREIPAQASWSAFLKCAEHAFRLYCTGIDPIRDRNWASKKPNH